MKFLKSKVELLSLDKNNMHDEAYHIYENIFSCVSGESESFQPFNSTKSFFITLSDKINSCDTLVIAVEGEEYLTVKELFFKALKTPTDINSEILTKVMDSCSRKLLDHSTIPVNASPLLTKSGRNSGFVQKIGKKTIIFLSLENDDAKDMKPLLKKLYPDISFEISTNISKDKKVSMQENSKNDDKVNSQKAIENEAYNDEYRNSKFQKNQGTLIAPAHAVKRLRKKNISVSVASSKYSDSILSIFNKSSNTLFSGADVICSAEPTKKEIATYALEAKNKNDASLGISISDIRPLDSNSEKLCIYICIVDSSHAHILKFKSLKNESEDDFLKYTVLCLFDLLAKYADTGIIKVPEKRLPISNSKKKQRTFIILIPMIAVIAILLVFFITNAYQGAYARKSAGRKDSTQIVQANADTFEDITYSEEFDSEKTFLSSFGSSSSSDSEETGKSENSLGNETQKPESSIPAITAKPVALTSTQPCTTVKVSTTAATTVTVPSIRKGVFTFTVYGYGHGVGMSQIGAKEFARKGYNYVSILKHYYHANGIKITKDTKIPKYVTHDGKKYELKDYLGKVTYAEISTSYPPEAIKAQIVAIYTYAKRNGFKTTSNGVAFKENFNYKGTPIESAINAVYGLFLQYNNEIAFCPYFSTSAGVTTSCRNVWGGRNYPYLMGGRTSPENPQKRVYTITSDDLKKKINKYNSVVSEDKRIVLPPDPSKWIKIIEHDGALNKNLGYISKIKIGNQVISGNNFRLKIFGASTIHSHCFTFTFTPN